jgi:hypothetical protein
MATLTEAEAHDFLRALFPGGLRDSRLLAELCPEGWENSPLFACFHPPPAMAYREYLAHRETMRSLDLGMSRRKGMPDSDAPPFEEPELGFDEFCETYADEWGKRGAGVDPVEESAELMGLCLWDVFSDNHEVIAADGRVADLGSFRGTAAEIADFFDESPAGEAEDEDEDDDEDEADDEELWGRRERSDYMRFYMGTIWVGGRADLAPVYRLIFQRLHACGADWKFDFPKLHLFSPGEVAEHAGLPYDPSAAVADESERAARESERQRVQAKLDRNNLAAQRAARSQPPPDTVRAYQEIYGAFPAGWPPDPYRLD